jgi:hypothetical protein
MPLLDRRAAIEQGVLVVLGAAAIAAGPALPSLLALAIAAGLAEAAAARRTGRRRPLASWVPAALGLLALSAGVLAWQRVGGPWHNDSGMAWGVFLTVLAVALPAFGLLVNAVAWVALRAWGRQRRAA